MASAIKAQAALFCDLCNSKDEVIKQCLICDEYMCRNCSTAHQRSRASKDHRVKILDGGEIAILEQQQKKYFCPKHSNEELQLFCKTCEILVCTDCAVIYEHKKHDFAKVKDICQDERKKLQNANTEIDNLVGYLKPVVDKLEIKKKEIMKQNQDMTKTNFAKTHNVIQLISKRRDHVNKQNEEITNTNMASIGQFENKLKKVLANLESLQTSVQPEVIQTLTDTDVVDLRYKVKANLVQINQDDFDITKLSLLPIQKVDLRDVCKEPLENSNEKVILKLEMATKPYDMIWSVCPISQTQVWVHIYGDYTNYLLNCSGDVENTSPCNFFVTKFALRKDRRKILASSYYNQSIKKMSIKGDQKTDFRTKKQMQYPSGFCISENGEVLVCMNKKDDATDDIMTIRRFSSKGEVIRTITYRCDYLQTDSVRVANNLAENPVNGNICLIERSDKYHGNLLILDSDGNKIVTYSGTDQHDTIDPSDVTCDEKGQIILADRNKKIHLLNQEGKFLQYIISHEEGIVPISLALDAVNGQLWVGCEEGTVLICRHD